MLNSEALIRLENSERILFRLCKHFALKVAVVHDGDVARIEFPTGLCTIARQRDELNIACAAPDHARLAVMQEVVASHLRLMARQPGLNVEWSFPGPGTVAMPVLPPA